MKSQKRAADNYQENSTEINLKKKMKCKQELNSKQDKPGRGD